MTSASRVAFDLIDQMPASSSALRATQTVRLTLRATVRIAAAILGLLFLASTSGAQAVNVLTGTYVGNGAASRAITGVGFAPDVVLVKTERGELATMRTATMPVGKSKPLGYSEPLQPNQILSLDADGFTVGGDDSVNKAGIAFYWVAFKAGAARMHVGSYTGTGVNGLSVGGIGFQPELVYVLGDGDYDGILRAADVAKSYEFGGDSGSSTGVTTLGPNGFTLGTDETVNQAGHTYHYIAWNEIPGETAIGVYDGDDQDNRNVTGIGLQPEWLVIKSTESAHAVHRMAILGSDPDATLHFKGPDLDSGGNRIQGLLADGFQVGTHSDTNKDNQYIYMAFKQQSAPTITSLADQSTLEDVPAGPVSFTIDDAQTPAASLTLAGLSSNPALLPNANIVFGGSGANRTVTLVPAPNAFGTANVTIQVSDGVNVTEETFLLTVTPVNDIPTISDIANQTTQEDTPTGVLAFVVGDIETAAGALVVSAVSNNATLVPNGNIVLGGSGANRTIVVTPAANQHGTATITVTVTDGAASASDTFVLTVTSTNDGPSISAIADQTVAEDTATGALPFTVADVDTPAGSLTLSATSSNPTLVPVANIVFGGADGNRTVTVTPAANQHGTATITVTVSDGSLTASEPFVLTVTSTNDGPTISAIADQTVAEDTATGALAFTVADVDTPAGSLTLSATSSNPTLVPVANIVFGGADGARTVTVTPAANQHGTATITVTVSDGSLTASEPFVLTVTSVNDGPSISAIADQTVAEDTATGALPFTVADVDTPAGSLTLSATSSNPTLVPVANIVFGGADGNRTVTVTPAANQHGTATITVTVSDGSLTASEPFVLTVTSVNDKPTVSDLADQTTNEDTTLGPLAFTVGDIETAAGDLVVTATSSDTTLVPNAKIAVLGSGANRTLTITPAANQHGVTTMTVTVSDGSLTASDTFVLTVVPVNDVPTISEVADQTTPEDTAKTATFVIGDIETPAASLTVSATSSNEALVPSAGLVLGGSHANRQLTMTPAANMSGTTVITLTVSDGDATATESFVLTVTAVNDAPTISPIEDQTIDEDTATGALAFTIADLETPAAGLVLTVTSTNTSLIPNAAIVLGGADGNRTVTLTPAANRNGASTITVTVSDGALSAAETFIVNVTPVNDPPTISEIPDQWSDGDPMGPVPFTVGDPDNDPSTLTITATSNNQVLVPNANITLTGSATNWGITIVPAPNQSGTAIITVTVSDGVNSTITTFIVTVELAEVTIEGVVTGSNGPVAGVTVQLQGGLTTTAVTDANGHYAFPGVPRGANYVVAPVGSTYAVGGISTAVVAALQTSANYDYTPSAKTLTNVQVTTVVNFEAVRMLVLSGRAQDLLEGGVEDVSMALTGGANATVMTDADGRYAFLVEEGGTYTVTPTRANFWFDPVSATRPNMLQNETADFTATGGAFTRYFAEGSTGGFFDTSFAVLNATLVPAQVTMRFERTDGTVISKNVVVPAETRVTVDPEQLQGLAQGEFSTVVASNVPVIADRTMTWDGRGYGSHAETSIAKPQTIWYLSEGATIAGFNLFYLIHNPNAQAAQIEVRYLLPAPQAPIVKTYTVGANSRYTIWVNQADPVLAAAEVSAVITSQNAVPVIVERSMYLDGPGKIFNAGHNGAGVVGPATKWFLAEGATGAFFDCFILVANPGTIPANVEAEFLLPDGTVIKKQYVVSGRSRFNIWVDLEDERLADTAVSTTVTSTNGVPIVVERAMWWPGETSDWQEGHNSVGATQSGAKWGLAEGQSGGTRSTETFVLVANTSEFEGRIRFSVILEDGRRFEQYHTLLPKSRFTVPVGTFFPEANGNRYGVMVESVGENPAQIVVERAMYSDAVDAQGHHSPWAAGTGALGTRIR